MVQRTDLVPVGVHVAVEAGRHRRPDVAEVHCRSRKDRMNAVRRLFVNKC